MMRISKGFFVKDSGILTCKEGLSDILKTAEPLLLTKYQAIAQVFVPSRYFSIRGSDFLEFG
jgi:hypothetical protein